MSRRILSMMAPFLALAGGYPEMRPLVSVQCPGCGMALAGIDAEAGHTRCRECRAPTQTAPPGPVVVVTHSDGGRYIPDPPSAASYGVISDGLTGGDTGRAARRAGHQTGKSPRGPLAFDCPTCKAAPGVICDRRTRGRKFFHRARVDSAGGGR